MALVKKEPDNRPRVRCPECGKRLKLPVGKPGKIFRCPVCGGSVIAPLDIGVVRASQRDLSVRALRRMGWSPAFMQKKRYKSIERVANFISKEYADLAQSCSTLLAGKAYPEHEAAGRIMTLRRDKGRRLVEFAKRTLAELNRDIREVVRHPMRRHPDMVGRLDQLKRERRDLAIFMKVMFNVDLPGVELGIGSPPPPKSAPAERPDSSQAPPPPEQMQEPPSAA